MTEPSSGSKVLIKCSVCGCQVRADRLERHSKKAHSPHKPKLVHKKTRIVAPIRHITRPSRRAVHEPSPIILKSRKAEESIKTTRKCDECGATPGTLNTFPKSNRNYTVLLCSACTNKVLNRSFPARRITTSRNRKKRKRRVFVQIVSGGLPQ